MNDQTNGLGTVLGLAAIGSAVVGIAGFIGALIPFFNGDFVGAGVLLAASALAFGLLSIAVLGK